MKYQPTPSIALRLRLVAVALCAVRVGFGYATYTGRASQNIAYTLANPATEYATISGQAVQYDPDDDRDVDELDAEAFSACWSGPGVPQGDPACRWARLDGDEDVDWEDYAAFQRCVSGGDDRQRAAATGGRWTRAGCGRAAEPVRSQVAACGSQQTPNRTIPDGPAIRPAGTRWVVSAENRPRPPRERPAATDRCRGRRNNSAWTARQPARRARLAGT